MSRTKEVVKNQKPCTLVVGWHGKKGELGFKRKGDTDFTKIETPFSFTVIDCDSFSVMGSLNQKKDSPKFISNTAHGRYSKILNVSLKGGDSSLTAKGHWADIKKIPGFEKAKFNQHIYCIVEITEGEKEIALISLHGRALSAWYEIAKIHDPNGKNSFSIDGALFVEDSDGNSSYVPIFTVHEISQINEDCAIDADTNLVVPYFDTYFNIAPGTEKEVLVPEKQDEDEDEDENDGYEFGDEDSLKLDIEDVDIDGLPWVEEVSTSKKLEGVDINGLPLTDTKKVAKKSN